MKTRILLFKNLVGGFFPIEKVPCLITLEYIDDHGYEPFIEIDIWPKPGDPVLLHSEIL